MLFESLFLKANTTLTATVIISLPYFTTFFLSLSYGGSFTLYSFLLDHLDHTFVNHLNFHSSACPIRHLLWLSVNGDGCDCTIQKSSSHKCGQKSCCHGCQNRDLDRRIARFYDPTSPKRLESH